MELLEDIEVVGLGQASLDLLGRVASFPQEDEKSELEGLEMQSGGPASTALVALARLGIKTSFLGSISDDYFGKEILKGLEEEGVDFSYLKISPGYTSQLAFIAITPPHGKRTVFWHRGTAPPLSKGEINLRSFPRAKILHVDGLMMEASIDAASQARELGYTVIMDGGTLRDRSMELIALVDILIASEAFANPLVGRDAPIEKTLEVLSGMGPGAVVITLGSKGSIGAEGGKIMFQPAFAVDAVDTTGAGDVFHGAYIFGVLQGWGMAESMRFASASAALKCRRVGARNGIPTLEETMRFLASSKVRGNRLVYPSLKKHL